MLHVETRPAWRFICLSTLVGWKGRQLLRQITLAPYWYNPVGSSTAVLSTATGTGGAAYGISVNNSYTAINTTSVPSQYPSAAREGQTEDDSDCTVGTSDVQYDCTVVSHGPHTQS